MPRLEGSWTAAAVLFVYAIPFSYHLTGAMADGTLRIILADDEHPPLPVHLVSPHGRLSVPKVRTFVDFALPRLRAAFGERALACSSPATTVRGR